jgi:NifU-like protein involved in Fe-S cluster formation
MTDFALYNQRILQLAASIPRTGKLDSPDVTVTARSRLCGSRITVQRKLAGDQVADYAQELRACVIGQAVASVVGRVIVGLPLAQIHVGAATLRALLQEKVIPATPPWAALEPFLPVADVPSRHGSALLPFDALERALEEIARQDGGPSAITFDQNLQAASG